MNHYTLLQIPPSATARDIQKAYRALVKQHHPDRLQQAPEKVRHDAEEKLKLINLAYGVLSHPAKRKQYDATLSWQTETTAQQTKRQNQGADAQAKQNGRTQSRHQSHYTASYSDLQQKLTQARRVYLHHKSTLAQLDAQIIRHLQTAVIQIGLISLIIGLLAAGMLTLFNHIVLNATAAQSANIILFLELWLLEISAAFIVLNRYGLPFHPRQLLRELFMVNVYMLVSLILVSLFMSYPFQVGSSWPTAFIYVALVQCIISGKITTDYLHPLIAQRKTLQTDIANAEDVLNYFRDAVEMYTAR